MERLNFSHLYYFYIVAKEGSVKSSAEKLHVSQPTISDQVKLLEEFLDCKLFERRNRSLFLTKEGKLALEYSEKIFDLGKDLTYRLRNKVHLPKKSLDIGITYFMSQYFLYEIILPLFNQNEITVKVSENDRHLLLADLEEGNIDVVFTDSKEGVSNSMNSFRVGENKTFAVAHKRYQKFAAGFPECLDSIPFFSYTNNSSLKYEIDLFFSKNCLAPKVVGEADDVELFEMVVSKGIAFCIVPEVAKNRLCLNKNIIVLGEVEELQTSVWGVIKNSNKGPGYKLLNGMM